MIIPTDHDRLRCAALHSYMDLRAAARRLRHCRPITAYRLLRRGYRRLEQALTPPRPQPAEETSHGR